jgi:dihydroxy-acid dehydratase
MAMARLDLPGLLLYGGSPEDVARVGAGACACETTASVMAIVAQMLGLSPMGFSDIAAGDARKDIAAVRCGELALRLLSRDRRPRQILSRAAFENAGAALAATVGGVGALVNVLALAREVGVPLSLADLDGLAARTPTLLDATPDRFKLGNFEQIGGTRLLARRLLDARLLRDGLTVSGATVFEEARRADEGAGQELLRTLANPIATTGSFVVLRGTLAPDGCLAAAAVPAQPAHSGPARLFDSERACLDAIAQQRIAPNDVLVVRYQGPKGGPGLRQTQAITAALIAAGLDGQVALVSDGRTGGRSAGLSVGLVTPEAFVGGPLAFVREGDVITIDTGKRTIDVGGDLDARRFNDSWQKPAPRFVAGVQARYAASVSSALDGAVCAAGRAVR